MYWYYGSKIQLISLLGVKGFYEIQVKTILKKPTWKVNCHVDKSGYHDDVDTLKCEDIKGTFTTCGKDVTLWKLKKFWYCGDN